MAGALGWFKKFGIGCSLAKGSLCIQTVYKEFINRRLSEQPVTQTGNMRT